MFAPCQNWSIATKYTDAFAIKINYSQLRRLETDDETIPF